MNTFSPFYRIKFRWFDGHGRQLTAGGILIYDDKGIWVIKELRRDGTLEYNDPGGKYKYEDCDINTTIAREANEEFYQSVEFRRSMILDLARTTQPVYVMGHHGLPVYICYLMHVNLAKLYGICMSPLQFLECRARTLRSNPNVPHEFYSSLELVYLTFTDIREKRLQHPLSYRLDKIVHNFVLRRKVEHPVRQDIPVSPGKEKENVTWRDILRRSDPGSFHAFKPVTAIARPVIVRPANANPNLW